MHWLDPDYLPETSGTVDRFLLNAQGDADGMILTDGAEIHFPPHMSAEIGKFVHPGASVKVRGVRPRSADLVAAVAIEAADGTRILDRGPANHQGEAKKAHEHSTTARKPMRVEGIVQRALHGAKGEVRGALLEDGRIVRFPPHEAERIADLIVVGALLAVRGEGLTNSVGTVIEAREIGATDETLRRVEGNKPEHDKKLKHDKPKGAKAPASSDNARAG
jgi:hypothetical protein